MTETARTQERHLYNLAAFCLEQHGGRSRIDPQDVVQEAYLKAASKLRSQPSLEIADIAAWFRRFVFLTCLNQLKKEKKEAALIAGTLLDEAETAENLDQRQDVARLLDKHLDDETDRTILRRWMAGYTSTEIATELGEELDGQAVRQRKSRALKKLRKALR